MADSLMTPDNDVNEREAIITKWKDKSPEELLNAKAESDLYIKTLTARLDDLKNDYLQLREQHQTGAQLKDIIDRLEKDRSSATSNDTHDTNRDTNVQPSLKPEDIQNLITQEIAKNKQLDRQTQNFQSVQARLREQFGDNYESVYKQRLGTLGLSSEFADDLARNHPTVFLKTFELDNPRQNEFQNLPRTQQRPTSFAPQGTKRDWNYYQKLKAENPRIYLDPKIAVQMHEDAIALGKDFGMPED